MPDTVNTETFPPATDSDGNLLLSAEEAQALLRECFAEFKSGLRGLVMTSIETTNDLFEMNEYVTEEAAKEFRSKRGEWVERFEATLAELFDKRLGGTRRSGRRPDFDASLTTLRVLNAFDQEKQAALIEGTAMLHRVTRREVDAIDLRVGVLLREPRIRDFDNPFAPSYALDAIGVASRALYPNPRVWRPLMERVLADVMPVVNKAYIRVNRFLADRHVLPEIKAELRARSELRPPEDSELLPTFLRLFKEAGSDAADSLLALNIEVPAASEPGEGVRPQAPAAPLAAPMLPEPHPAPVAPSPTPPLVASSGHPTAPPPSMPNPYVAELAQPMPAASSPPAATGVAGLPQLDPLLALGSLASAVAALDRWQRSDPGGQYVGLQDVPAGTEAAALPLNRIPYIRAAIAEKIVNSTDKITIDVIGLLFDYIFRDPSIPESLRSLFSRLQVPILKTALIDRSFFSNKKHPARRLLDHLAAAAIGATGDAGYCAAFELVTAGIIDEVCRDFKVDVATFDVADSRLLEFVDSEQKKVSAALDVEVVQALAVEQSESDRSHVRALIRDKLAGLDVPFDVRSFSETVWADYLTEIRVKLGPDSSAGRTAEKTLDDLLWSITAKERTAQKARLASLVPAIVRSLRAGAAAVKVAADRVQPCLDVMFRMHMAAIKPKAAVPAPLMPAAPPADAITGTGVEKIENIHDFVNELVVGTWLAFGEHGNTTNARLSWVSPLRSKYIFTSRARTKAIVVTPEELAWQLGAGKATVVVEPVPLFDRAVSAALDSIAARTPPAAAAPA